MQTEKVRLTREKETRLFNHLFRSSASRFNGVQPVTPPRRVT